MSKIRCYLSIDSIKSIVVMVYFIVLIVHNLYDSLIIDGIWYLSLLLLVFFSFDKIQKIYCDKKILIFFILYSITSILNIFLVGNNTMSDIVFTFIYICVFVCLSDEELSEKILFLSIVVDCILVYINIFQKGLGTQILKDVSNNYISVLLLLPTVVYYIRIDWKNEDLSLIPSFCVWIASLLAIGRGGIISSSLLFIGLNICLYCNYQGKKLTRWKLFQKLCFLILVVVISIYLSIWGSQLFIDYVFQRFNKLGFYGTERMGIWSEYISNAVSNIKNLILGVNYNELLQMVRYKDNLHNSFLNIHVNNGIIMFLYVIIYALLTTYYLAKNKKWVSLICIMAFFIRAFTDRMFWGGMVGTPILFFVIWFPFVLQKNIGCKRMIYEKNRDHYK